MVLALWEVAAILGNGCGIQGQNYVARLQGSKMPVGFHYKNLIYTIHCIRLNVSQWSKGQQTRLQTQRSETVCQ